MIPAKVSLKNFLTFAADTDGSPVVLDFEGASLWSIAGVNGAGKSTIFDAITYTLFGEHRGGNQHDNRLIRKGATTAEAAFEFIQGGQRYRVERSITRKTGRHGEPRSDAKHVQASMWSDRDQAWVAIPDTDKATELEKWVKSILGMGPESFRSAVLLRQGEADKLLNAKASQRFQILAGLIDLRAYQQLEQLALTRRKAADTEADLLDQQLADIDPITSEQVAEAASQLARTEDALETADRERLQASHRCQGAQRHAHLQQRRNELLERKAELDAIAGDAVNIRTRAAEHTRIEKMIEPTAAALAELHGAAAAAAEAEGARTRLEAIDLAALELAAAEAETAWQQLDDDVDRLNDRAVQLASVLTSAKEVHRCRADQATREQALAKSGDPAELRARAEHLARDLEAAQAKVAPLEADQGEALTRTGAAQGRLQRASERLKTLEDLAGEPTCSRCGQPITAGHLERERSEAASEFEEATAQIKVEQAAVDELGGSIAAAKKVAGDLDAQLHRADKAADAAKTVRRELDHAAAQVKAAAQVATESARGTAEEPVIAVIIGGQLDEAERTLQSLRSLDNEARKLIGQIRKDRDKAKTLTQAAKKALDEGRREYTDLQQTASSQQQRARHLTKQAQIRLADLPRDIVAAVNARNDEILEQLQGRLTELADAPAALGQLEITETELIAVSTASTDIQHDLAQIPPDQRIPPAEAQAALQQAEGDLKEAQGRRDTLRDEHNRLAKAQQLRARLGTQLAARRQRSRIARRLATLLGKTQLQARLLTDATTGVEAYANDTLARISGCTLEIALRQEAKRGESALDILVNDRSSAQEPLEVAFISGSQKFRVAVALAAGLGQYLGGGTSIRSLIIDEGFGSLDADGRQRMIHELRALAEHLDRIIVVSHQEDFADRTLFPAEYVLRKDGTRTTVEKVS
jgi:DNA repair exonuclease SbcCD ATPase subunit